MSNSNQRQQHGRDAVLLLTILLQYRKYETENPYVVKLSILDDEMALTGLAAIMSYVFADYNRVYSNSRKEQEGESSWWNNVGTMIGNMFIGDEEKRRAMKLASSFFLIDLHARTAGEYMYFNTVKPLTYISAFYFTFFRTMRFVINHCI